MIYDVYVVEDGELFIITGVSASSPKAAENLIYRISEELSSPASSSPMTEIRAGTKIEMRGVKRISYTSWKNGIFKSFKEYPETLGKLKWL